MTEPTPATTVLGVRVDCVNKQELIDRALSWAETGKRRRIFYVNAHCLNMIYQHNSDVYLFNQSDLVYADGIGVVWAARLNRGCSLTKITGREWIIDFCQAANQKNLSIYILAGKPGIALKASQFLKQSITGIKIAGTADGFFLEKTEDQVLAEIQASSPDVLFVGMGTPVQERWIAAVQAKLPVNLFWSVGALFDYVAGVEPQVPGWLEKYALEWFWRMLIDPLGKWKRYIIGNPLFVLRVARERLAR